RSIMLSGDVSMTADQPVATGTPYVVRQGNQTRVFDTDPMLDGLLSANNSTRGSSASNAFSSESNTNGTTNSISQFASLNGTSGIQMLGLSNAQNVNGIIGNANNLALLGGAVGGTALGDDSVMSVDGPSGTNVSAKFCSDQNIGFAGSDIE